MYTSLSNIIRDLIAALTAAGLKNDNLPQNAPPPNTPVFRVRLDSLAAADETMLQHGDTTTLKARIAITYYVPGSGGNPQEAELTTSNGIESLLDAITNAKEPEVGNFLNFTSAVVRPYASGLQTDLYFDVRYARYE